ncbi:MAG: MATE family efflux transporter [Erysipelotrichaceae bacterium]
MKLTNNFQKDNITKLVFALAIPCMIAQLVNVLYSIIDKMFIGNIPNIGDIALAGVGICGPIVTFLSSFGTLIGLGGSIYMAMKMGEKDHQKAQQILSNSFILLIIISLLLTFVFLIFKSDLIMLFGGSPKTYIYANEYFTIYTYGTFFALMTIGMNYFITCQGFSSIAMFTVVFGAITNIILDYIFINIYHYNVTGAAYATVIAQICSCGFALGFLLSKRCPIRLSIKKLNKTIIKKIFSIGLSPFLIISLDSFIIIVLNMSIQNFSIGQGDLLISANTIAQSYLLLITGPLIGITSGTQAILSYNYGAGDSNRVKQASKVINLFAIAFTTLMFVLTHLFGAEFISLFTDNPQVSGDSLRAIKILVIMIIPLGLEYSLVDQMTAIGRVKSSLTISLMRKSFYIGSCIILPFIFGVNNIFYCQPIADIIGTIGAVLMFKYVFNDALDKRVMETQDYKTKNNNI